MKSDDDQQFLKKETRRRMQKALSELRAGTYSGPISFYRRRSKNTKHSYPLKLTPEQRQTLCEQISFLGGRLMKKLKQAGEGTQLVGVTCKGLGKLYDKISQYALF
ncbi:MAG: hypothetical protein ACKPEY_07410, partial [Planctomycetota bacterium]